MNIAISKAEDSDLEEVAALVNAAFRGESSRAGWATEEELVDGQRTDPQTLRDELAKHQPAVMLCLRQEGPIDGCVLLEKKAEGTCYLGMLTVRPTIQARGLGRILLEHSEDYCRREWGARRMLMTVIPTRTALVEWYERRGYRKNGETAPFPYGDERFGIPRVDNLYFIVLEKLL